MYCYYNCGGDCYPPQNEARAEEDIRILKECGICYEKNTILIDLQQLSQCFQAQAKGLKLKFK